VYYQAMLGRFALMGSYGIDEKRSGSLSSGAARHARPDRYTVLLRRRRFGARRRSTLICCRRIRISASSLEEQSQYAENQLEQILHPVANLPRLFSASMLNRIFGTHRSMFGVDLQTIASAALVAGVAISKRVPTFVLKRRGHSCQKSETTRNDRAFIA
jgi:hypothetical protein